MSDTTPACLAVLFVIMPTNHQPSVANMGILMAKFSYFLIVAATFIEFSMRQGAILAIFK